MLTFPFSQQPIVMKKRYHFDFVYNEACLQD